MAKVSTARVTEEAASKAAIHRARTRAVNAAMALFDRAVAFNTRGQTDEAIAAFDKLVARFGSANELVLLILTANALFAKGAILQQLLQPTAAIEAYDALVVRFDTAEEPQLVEAVAKALQNKGLALYVLGRPSEAIKVYDEFEERFGSTTDPVLGRIVGANRFNRKIASYDEVIERFDSIPDPPLYERVAAATALVSKGISCGEEAPAGGKETAIENYDAVVARFGAARCVSH
jgi:tetratricopeptide (TPR) repeat protein